MKVQIMGGGWNGLNLDITPCPRCGQQHAGVYLTAKYGVEHVLEGLCPNGGTIIAEVRVL